MTTATETRITRREPLLGQLDLRCIREAAARIVVLRQAAPYLPRGLSCAELQLIAACDAIVALVQGEYGTDGNGDTVGDLTLREVPNLPIAHQPKLTEDNGARSI